MSNVDRCPSMVSPNQRDMLPVEPVESDTTQSPFIIDPEHPANLHRTSTGDAQGQDSYDTPLGRYASIPAEEPRAPSTRHSTSTAVDDSSGPEKSLQQDEYPGRLGILHAWSLEALSLLVSIAAFVAIAALLFLYDGKPQPEFAYSLNINTLIAISTTILRATLVFMVAGVIGQSKWLWMKSPRPLRDIEVFDNAGRGAWGSLKFLFFSWKPITTILSAFVVLASYGIGPFSQQAAKTYPCDIPAEGVAYILAAEWVGQADVNPTAAFEAVWLSPEMRASMVNGLVQGVSSGSLGLSQCKSSKCTFDAVSDITHQSVGVCSACVDIRDQLVEGPAHKSVGGIAFRLPNSSFGVDISPEPQVFDMSTPQTPNALRHLLDFESSTVGTQVVTLTANNCTIQVGENGRESRHCGHDYDKWPSLGQRVDIVAADCSLYPCLRKYHGQIVNGILDERLVSTEPMRRSMNTSSPKGNVGGYMIMAEPCLVGGNWYDSSNISQAPRAGTNWTSWATQQGRQDAPSECVRVMDFEAFIGIEQFISSEFKGSCTAYHGAAKKLTSAALESPMLLQCNQWWMEILHKEGMATFTTISTSFENMATAISDRMRIVGENWSRTGGASVSGRGIEATICIQADWPWLLYPGTLLVLASGLLVSAYLRGCRDRVTQPVWKSSILPLMFYDLVPERKSLEGGMHDQEPHGRLLQLKQL